MADIHRIIRGMEKVERNLFILSEDTEENRGIPYETRMLQNQQKDVVVHIAHH